MNRTTAHLILGFFDVAALYACYYVYTEWRNLKQLLALNVSTITYQEYFCAYLLLMAVPVVHIMSFIDWQDVYRKLANIFLILIFLLIFLAVVGSNSLLEHHLLKAAYTYCPQQSETMTFFGFKTYFNKESLCTGP